MGLNFGGTAFDGSNRWVQLEFRSPAGSGQYLTLNPRDKIMATPYAMFALNGGNGIWNYNPKLQTVSVLGQKVGIGTANPTAALEVVGSGGDDSVKLPEGSVGESELTGSFAAAASFHFSIPPEAVNEARGMSFTAPGDGFINITGVYSACGGCTRLEWNGNVVSGQSGYHHAMTFSVVKDQQCSFYVRKLDGLGQIDGAYIIVFTARTLG